jgi:hypothetical protein
MELEAIGGTQAAGRGRFRFGLKCSASTILSARRQLTWPV